MSKRTSSNPIESTNNKSSRVNEDNQLLTPSSMCFHILKDISTLSSLKSGIETMYKEVNTEAGREVFLMNLDNTISSLTTALDLLENNDLVGTCFETISILLQASDPLVINSFQPLHNAIYRKLRFHQKSEKVVVQAFVCLGLFYSTTLELFNRIFPPKHGLTPKEFIEILLKIFKVHCISNPVRESFSLLLLNFTAQCNNKTREVILSAILYTLRMVAYSSPTATEYVLGTLHNICFDSIVNADQLLLREREVLTITVSSLKRLENNYETVCAALTLIADLAQCKHVEGKVTYEMMGLLRETMKKHVRNSEVITCGCKALCKLIRYKKVKSHFISVEENFLSNNQTLLIADVIQGYKTDATILEYALEILIQSLSEIIRMKLSSNILFKKCLMEIGKNNGTNLPVVYASRNAFQLIYDWNGIINVVDIS